MLEKLLERKKKLEHEIYLMEFIDIMRPEQKRELEQYESELRNVEYQISQIAQIK